MLLFACHAYFNQAPAAKVYESGDRVLLARAPEVFQTEQYTQEQAALALITASFDVDNPLHERALRVGDVIRVDKVHRTANEMAYAYQPSMWMTIDPTGLSRLTGHPRLTGHSLSPIFS